jgi:hypothetical protein
MTTSTTSRTVCKSLPSAAAILDTTPEALRARCQRAATHEGDRVVADLGAGIRAFKLRRTWRIQLPEEYCRNGVVGGA